MDRARFREGRKPCLPIPVPCTLHLQPAVLMRNQEVSSVPRPMSRGASLFIPRRVEGTPLYSQWGGVRIPGETAWLLGWEHTEMESCLWAVCLQAGSVRWFGLEDASCDFCRVACFLVGRNPTPSGVTEVYSVGVEKQKLSLGPIEGPSQSCACIGHAGGCGCSGRAMWPCKPWVGPAQALTSPRLGSGPAHPDFYCSGAAGATWPPRGSW